MSEYIILLYDKMSSPCQQIWIYSIKTDCLPTYERAYGSSSLCINYYLYFVIIILKREKWICAYCDFKTNLNCILQFCGAAKLCRFICDQCASFCFVQECPLTKRRKKNEKKPETNCCAFGVWLDRYIFLALFILKLFSD